MEQNQEMKLLLKQNSKILEFCLGGILPLLRASASNEMFLFHFLIAHKKNEKLQLQFRK